MKMYASSQRGMGNTGSLTERGQGALSDPQLALRRDSHSQYLLQIGEYALLSRCLQPVCDPPTQLSNPPEFIQQNLFSVSVFPLTSLASSPGTTVSLL